MSDRFHFGSSRHRVAITTWRVVKHDTDWKAPRVNCSPKDSKAASSIKAPTASTTIKGTHNDSIIIKPR